MRGDKHHHHYIPDFILRRYSYEDYSKKSKAHMVDLTKGKIMGIVQTRNMYYRDNLYRFRIEDIIGKQYETPVSRLLSNVENSQGTFDVSINDILILRKYLLLQLIRTKDEKDSYSDIPEVWNRMINKAVSKESLKSMIKTGDVFVSKMSQFFLYSPLLFVKTDGGLIMPDGALMEDYIAYPEWINEDIIIDEYGHPRIENGVHPDCPPGKMVNYIFYPMGPEYGVMLLNPLWTNKDFAVLIGSNTYAINPAKIVETVLKYEYLDNGRTCRMHLITLDEEESNRLIKEIILSCRGSFVVRDLDKLIRPLSDLIEDKPDYLYFEQIKAFLDYLKDNNSHLDD